MKNTLFSCLGRLNFWRLPSRHLQHRLFAPVILFLILLSNSALAASLVNGGFVSGSIESPGDQDTFTLDLNAGQFVNLTVADINQTRLVPRITLYAPDGVYLTAGSGGTVAPITNFQVFQSGTYTVIVQDSSFNGSVQTGTYEVHFASAPVADEHGLLINGGSRTEALSVGDLDSFTFTAGAGEFVNLTVADINQTGLVPQILLYAPDGAYLTRGSGGAVAPITNFQVPQSGTYTVIVKDSSFNGPDQTGDYEVHFARAPGANELGLLLPGISRNETISTGDLDTFTFTAMAGSLLDMSVLDTGPSGLSPGFVLYGPTGEYLTLRNDFTEARLAGYKLNLAGTYTILVQDWSFNGRSQTGDYRILIGLDGGGGTTNAAPIANAGTPVSVAKGVPVDLSGSGSSDPDGGPQALTYNWEMIQVPPASQITTSSLSATNDITTSFLPDVGGRYVVSLSVSDGDLEDTDTVQITVLNEAPIASAGTDQQVVIGQPVSLNGSGSSDPDGDMLNYAWTLTLVPDGSTLAGVTNANEPFASFTPDVVGVYEATLIVDDGENASALDTVVITVSAGNAAPTVVISAPSGVSLGDTVSLDGSGSSDSDGGPDPLTFEWTLLATPSGSLLTSSDITGRLSDSASFVPDVEGSYTVQLQVSDGESIATDSVEIVSGPGNLPPSADAGDDSTVSLNDTVFLNGNGSADADNGPAALSFEWRFVSTPNGSALEQSDIVQANAADAQFVPDVAGNYILQLEVDDGELSDRDTLTITVEGPNQPQICELNGDGVVDRNDIQAIMAIANTAATGPDDPADWNRDGTINVLDARGCARECSLPRCAYQ